MVEKVTSAAADSTANRNEVVQTLPQGKYTLVGIDIDTTGRRLIDEIVQLAAYTPNDHFEQYIMPYMNLNPAARQRHQVRVISIGFYRMLKSMQTYKIIKSKSEVAALKDFLDWLEAIKAKDVKSSGIILVYYEERKFIPYMILESLKKYNLLDRFLITVKSFTNGLNLAKANANGTLQHYTLRKLSRVLSAKNDEIEKAASSAANGITKKPQQSLSNDRDMLFDGNASVRAKLTYDVALQLSNSDKKIPLDSSDALDNLRTAVHPYSQPIDCDLNELQTQNQNLERQNSFRPVFLNYFKTTLYHRVRAVKFRIILAENGFDLSTLNAIWSEKQMNGIVEVLKDIEQLKEEDKTELADLLDSFFDPGKTTIKPVVRNNNRRRNRRGSGNGGARNSKNDGNNTQRTEQGAGGDKQAGSPSPDSTTKPQTPQKAGKPMRGRRGSNARQNALKNQIRGVTETATASTNTPNSPGNNTAVAVAAAN